jgi:N-acetylglucosamine-6-phosphate deacetylase
VAVGDLTVLAGKTLLGGALVGPVMLTITDGRISAVEPGGSPSGRDAVIDASDSIVVPGLIDVHTHGGGGAQVIDGVVDDLDRLASFYAAHGVTGYLATIGGSMSHILAGLRSVRAYLDRPPGRGARCLGVHLEGPFISPSALGAFRPDSVQPPDPAVFAEILDASGGHLRRMTIAPEVDGADAVIDLALRNGVACSVGHSVATTEEVSRAVDAGVRSVTHMFNGMAPFHHRRPGLVGAALTDSRLVTEVIADGIHIHPTALRLLAQTKGTARMALVSDSIAATGLPDGDYHFEDLDISVTDGAARLADGTLAGSTLTLDRAVSNFARWAGIPWEEAVLSATEVPARLLGMDGQRGKIAVGQDADLAAFDAGHELGWTMVAGEVQTGDGRWPA